MYCFALNYRTFADTESSLYISLLYIFLLYFTLNITDRWTAPLSYNSINKTASLSLLFFIHSCNSPISNDHDILSFGPEHVANLILGPHYFLKHVPTLKWLVCAKNAAAQGGSSLWEGRDGRWVVEKQLRCWLLTIKTFPSTNRAFIYACQTQRTTVAPVTEP